MAHRLYLSAGKGIKCSASDDLTDVHRLEFTAGGLRRLGELDQATGTSGHHNRRPRLFDVEPLILQDLHRRIGIIDVEGPGAAAACVGLLHLDEVSRRL